MRIFGTIADFEWDDGNRDKILRKHGVSPEDCEEVFQDEQRRIAPDVKHSAGEDRYILIGKTRLGKVLFVVFTIRKDRFRIISARPVNKKEWNLYE